MEHEKRAAAEQIERNFHRAEAPTPHVHANRLGDEAAGQACREPSWHEMGVEAKVERLREQLRFIASHVDTAGKVASEAHAIVLTHEHHPIKGLFRPVFAEHGYGTPGWSEVSKMIRGRLA
jgi:hypothetical protein